MKGTLLCLDCFMRGRVHALNKGTCPECGCKQSVVYAPAAEPEHGEPDYVVWPYEGPICPDHKDSKFFQ